MGEKYYISIKEKILQSEIYDKARDYAKDRNKVKVYFEIGKLLSNAGKDYGKNIIKQYSEKLMLEVGKKYNYRTLYRMRKFYELFDNEKLTTLLSKLSWSYFNEVLSLKKSNEISYYLNQSIIKTLSVRQLREIIKSNEYDRLSADTKNKMLNNQQLDLPDIIPNPVVIKVNDTIKELTEYALKELILNNLDDFLLQLGNGFTYIGNEFKIKIGDRYNFIDIFLYNIKYKCYVVIELKVTELKSNHTGQIQKYMNYVDRHIKAIEENDTVGIIICKKNNQYVIDCCSDKRILSREYELI
ncbi:MAG: PDDEXK nuclease domain-containing protein [Firmicutes bacterium]|nr:PDDEXK nuclease domain-containing protein [Bacillota bacterium]